MSKLDDGEQTNLSTITEIMNYRGGCRFHVGLFDSTRGAANEEPDGIEYDGITATPSIPASASAVVFASSVMLANISATSIVDVATLGTVLL